MDTALRDIGSNLSSRNPHARLEDCVCVGDVHARTGELAAFLAQYLACRTLTSTQCL